MIGRRGLLAGLGSIIAAGDAWAQTSSPPLVIWMRSNAPERPPGENMRQALARHGLSDGRDYKLMLLNSDGSSGRFTALALEAVAAQPALVVAFGTAATRAIIAASSTIPIVGSGDLVGFGLADSIARPGGNVTGVNTQAPELDLKKFEIISELLPRARRVAWIYDPTSRASSLDTPANVSSSLGLELVALPVNNTDDIRKAFAEIAGRVAAVNVSNAPLLSQNRLLIVELLHQHQLPGVCEWREMAEAGCLASYGFVYDDLMSIAADYTARILRGVRPAELPIVSMNRVQYVVNQRVAKELDVTIPLAALARADEVIE
jgi:putative ABC transport system substrate-binding protein